MGIRGKSRAVENPGQSTLNRFCRGDSLSFVANSKGAAMPERKQFTLEV
jgi:hypothetical protein